MGLMYLTSLIVIKNKIANFAMLEIEKRRKLKEQELYLEVFSKSSSLNELLDSYISEILDEYRVFNPQLFSGDYLSDSAQEKIAKDIIQTVKENMSPALMNQLNIVFNKSALPQIMERRVTMAVVAMAVEFNNNDVKMENILK